MNIIERAMEKIKNFYYNNIIRNIIFPSRIARRSMFGYANSGMNFDYIYRNIATGYTRLGKLIDRLLLNLPSARATRDRKEKIVKIIKKEIRNNISINKKTKIVDLGSGPARYLIEAITREDKDYVEALCLDIDPKSIQRGRQLARDCSIVYKLGNVFRLGPYKRLSRKVEWRPNVVIASGLYLYYDDNFFKMSIKEIFEELEENGLFVFDNLVDNPNKQLLSRLGITKSGKHWSFYYRTPDMVKEYLSESGFRHLEILPDKWNMYILYKAKK